MNIDGTYMFGTTKKTEDDKDGELVYIWRVTLESSNNFIETNSLIGSRIEIDHAVKKRFATGIHKKLLGTNHDVIHLVFEDYSDEELWYLKASLEGVSSTAHRIYTKVKVVGDTWFIWNNSYETYGVETEILQSFTAAMIKETFYMAPG